MPRRAKIALVATVLVVGFVVALQFRKSPTEKSTAKASAHSETTQTTATQKPEAQMQHPAPPLDFSTAAPQTGAVSDTGSPGNADAAATNAGSSLGTDSAAASAPIPGSSTSTTPPAQKPAESTPDVTAGDHTASVSGAKPSEATVPDLPPRFSGVDRPARTTSLDPRSDALTEDAPSTTHKVVDGDSLPLLAERYLGSASRAAEIFACNRDVLSDPELLPIGAHLRMPTGPARSPPTVATDPPILPPSAPPANASVVATPVDPSVAAKSAPAQIAIDAVKAPPLMDISAPALSPLPPIGDQVSPAAHIYIVQAGDTLSSIAQRLYGDSGRVEAILQANRDQLHSEQELQAGMVLEVP